MCGRKSGREKGATVLQLLLPMRQGAHNNDNESSKNCARQMLSLALALRVAICVLLENIKSCNLHSMTLPLLRLVVNNILF